MAIVEEFESEGDLPLPSFGHSVTSISQNKIILFGGTLGTGGKFKMSSQTYLFNNIKNIWFKMEVIGKNPCARAGHSASAVETLQMILYGGATGGGDLAKDELFLMTLKDEETVEWIVIPVNGVTPGKRYGHTISFVKPNIVLFGGNNGSLVLNDVWTLQVNQTPFTWKKVNFDVSCPPARVYHSASLCQSGSTKGMIVIFGGRGSDQKPLNDIWGLRKHRTGNWDWVQAPCKNDIIPFPRYQHSSVFLDGILVILGGRKNNIAQKLPIETYDVEKSEWKRFQELERFRLSCWTFNSTILIFGGLIHSTPNMPLDSLMTLKFDNSEIIPAKIELEKEIVDTIPEAEEKTEESPKVEPKLPEKSKSVESKRSERKEKELEEKEEESPCKSFDFRLSSECHVAMSYSSDMPPNFSRMVRTLAIDKLQEESKKMGGSKPKTHSKRKHKASQSEHICNMFINQLLKPHEWSTTCLERRFLFKSQYIIELADQCTKILQDQPTVLRCKPPIKVFGDIHGQFQDLMRFFDLWRAPTDIGHGGDIESYDYLFLGDFVDRGSASLETVCLLMALKVKFPNSIHLIRGNHEDKWINNVFGFAEECSERLGEDVDDPRSVFNAINNMFEWLPLAAIIQDEIICLHGGIGASLDTVKDIEELVRPLEVIHEVSNSVEQKLVDILWSDPTDNDEEHGIQPNTIRDPNGTGNIVRFGPDRVQQFLQQNGLGMIIRAHECVMDGFERFADGKLITVFSATDYCGRHKNAGAVLVIQKNLEIIPKLIFPLDLTSHNTWIENEKRPPTPPRWKRD